MARVQWALVAKFIKDLGFEPDDVAMMEVTPHVVIVETFKRNEDGSVQADVFGAKTTKHHLNIFRGAE